MVGYTFLLISVLAGAVKGFYGKKVGGFATNVQSAVLMNLVRMLFCMVLSMGVVLFCGDISRFTLEPKVLLIAALSGVSNAVFVVSWLFAVRKSAYMLVDVFLMLGTLVPILSGSVLYAEPISLRQWIGFVVLVAAVLIMCAYNSVIRSKPSLFSLCALFVCGLSSGVSGATQKSIVIAFPDLPVSIFTVYTYIFAAITLALGFAVAMGKMKAQFQKGSSRTVLLHIVIMSAALIANSYFKTLAARHLDSMLLYPLSQGLSLALATLMAASFFKEKITFKAFTGIVLAFVALLMINL